MVGNGFQGRRDDDASGLLVVECNSLFFLEGRRCPVVHHDVQLLFRFAWRLDNLLVGQRLVLVEGQAPGKVGSGVQPLVAVLALGVFLQVGGLHHLCLYFDGRTAQAQQDGHDPCFQYIAHISNSLLMYICRSAISCRWGDNSLYCAKIAKNPHSAKYLAIF